MEIIKQITYQPADITGGYTDRILNVDLDSNEITITELPPGFKEKYVGGRGYALKLIWDGTTKETRYDSPENILVMASGPLGNETGFPGTGKFIVGTVSPLTDTFVDSNIGGHFGPLLKMAGFDALAVTGKAADEVVLLIDGDAGTVSIAKAPVYDAETGEGALSYGTKLLAECNDGELTDTLAAVTAGKGALNSRFGIVDSLYYDRRRNRVRAKQAGRGGTGTVMRTKGLRGVVVRSGKSKANANNAADREAVRKAGSLLRDVVSNVDPGQLNLEAWGTTILSEYMNRFFIFPVNNYQYGQSPDAPEVFSNVFLDRYFSKKMPDGCYYGCNLACAKGAEDVTLTLGAKAGRTVSIDGPEYETVGAVAAMGIFDPQFVMEYNWYCDEYGLDTISTGVVIAFLMECFQRGYLTAEDTGCELDFGNKESAMRLVHEIADGKGFGKEAGQGVARVRQWVAERYAARTETAVDEVIDELKKFAMETKGLEFSMYGTKESLAQQGGYGFALKGPQHDEAWLIFLDQVYNEMPTLEQKADACRWFPLVRTWFNATGLCKLPWIDVRNPEAANTAEPSKNIPTLEYYRDLLNGTTGSSKSIEDMLADSERLYVLQKLINLRQGKGTRASDQIPVRAIGPVYFNEYESRMEYYDNWLEEQADGEEIPGTPEERHELLIRKRLEAYQNLCDIVYEKKGFTRDAVPKRETVEKFGLLDEQADRLLAEYGL
jgi:aldehyde:ferredoxin oxidoreductase